MAYIFAADSMGLSSFNFFVVGSESRIYMGFSNENYFALYKINKVFKVVNVLGNFKYLQPKQRF